MLHIPVRSGFAKFNTFDTCDTSVSESTPYPYDAWRYWPVSNFISSGFISNDNNSSIRNVDLITRSILTTTAVPTPLVSGLGSITDTYMGRFIVSPDNQYAWYVQGTWADFYRIHKAHRPNYDRLWTVSDPFGTPTFTLVWSGTNTSADYLWPGYGDISSTTLGTGYAALSYTLSGDPHVGPYTEHIHVWGAGGSGPVKLDTGSVFTLSGGHPGGTGWDYGNNPQLPGLLGSQLSGSPDGNYLIKTWWNNHVGPDGFEVYSTFSNGGTSDGTFTLSNYLMGGLPKFLSDGRLVTFWMNDTTYACYLAIFPAGESPLTSTYEWIDLEYAFILPSPPYPDPTDALNSLYRKPMLTVMDDLSHILVECPALTGGGPGYYTANVLIKAPFTAAGHTIVRHGVITGLGTFFLPTWSSNNTDTTTITTCDNLESTPSIVSAITWGTAPYTFTDPGGWPTGISFDTDGTFTINVDAPLTVTKTISLRDSATCHEEGTIDVTINVGPQDSDRLVHIPLISEFAILPTYETCDTGIDLSYATLPTDYNTADFKVLGLHLQDNTTFYDLLYVDLATRTILTTTATPPRLEGDTHWQHYNDARQKFAISPDGQYTWLVEGTAPDQYYPHYAIRQNYDRIWTVSDTFGTPTFNLIWSGSVSSYDFIQVNNSRLLNPTTLGDKLASLCYTLSDPHLGPFVEHILLWNSSGTLLAKLDTGITYTAQNPGHGNSGSWDTVHGISHWGTSRIRGSLDGNYLIKSHPTNPNYLYNDNPAYLVEDGFEVYETFTNGAGPTGTFTISGYVLTGPGSLKFLSDGRLLSVWMNPTTKAYYLAVHPAGESPLTSTYEWIDLNYSYPNVIDQYNSGTDDSYIKEMPDLSYLLVSNHGGPNGSPHIGALLKAPFTTAGCTIIRNGSAASNNNFLPPAISSNSDTTTINVCASNTSSVSILSALTWGRSPYTVYTGCEWPAGISLSSGGTFTIADTAAPQTITRTLLVVSDPETYYTPFGIDNGCKDDGLIAVTLNVGGTPPVVKVTSYHGLHEPVWDAFNRMNAWPTTSYLSNDGLTHTWICGENQYGELIIDALPLDRYHKFSIIGTLPTGLEFNEFGLAPPGCSYFAYLWMRPSQVGTFPITIVAEDCEFPCFASIDITITIIPRIQMTPHNIELCAGQSIDYQYTITGGTPPYKFVPSAESYWLTTTGGLTWETLSSVGCPWPYQTGRIFGIPTGVYHSATMISWVGDANYNTHYGADPGMYGEGVDLGKINIQETPLLKLEQDGIDIPSLTFEVGLPLAHAYHIYLANMPILTGYGHGNITWLVEGLPAGLYATRCPGNVLVGPSMADSLRIDGGTSAAPGTYNITVTATTPLLCGTSVDFTLNLTSNIYIENSYACVDTETTRSLNIFGGTAPYTVAISGGTPMPTGFALDSAGVITGSGSVLGTTPITVTVTDSSDPTVIVDVDFDFTVQPYPILEYDPTLLTLEVGTPVSYTITSPTTGTEQLSWIVTGLPTGLTHTVNVPATSMTISGTPTTTEVTDTVITTAILGTVCTFDTHLAIVTNPLVFTTTNLDVCGGNTEVFLEILVSGGTPVYTFVLESGTLPTGLTFYGDGTIDGTVAIPTDPVDEYILNVTVTDESTPTPLTANKDITLKVYTNPSLAYTLPDPITTYQSISFDVDTQLAYEIPVNWIVTLPPGLSFAETTPGDPRVITISGYIAEAGTYLTKILAQTSVGCLDEATFDTVVGPGIGITEDIINICSGIETTANLGVMGGTPPYTVTTISTLPTGITLNSDGSFSGTTTELGTFSLDIEASDSTSPTPYTVTKTVPLVVSEVPNLAYTLPADLILVNVPLTFDIDTQIIAAAIVTWGVTNLPTGLNYSQSVNSKVLTVYGTPSVIANNSVVITAQTTAGCEAIANFAMNIASAMTLTTDYFDMCQTVEISTQLEITGGTAPYTFGVTGIPPGTLIVSSSGLLTGAVADSGVYSFEVTITDSSAIPIVITPSIGISVTNKPSLSTNRNTSLVVGVYANDFGLIADNLDIGTIVDFTVTNLPPGLTYSISADPKVLAVNGTPTTAGDYQVEVTATVQNTGCSDTHIFDMLVLSALDILTTELNVCQDTDSTSFLEGTGGAGPPYSFTTSTTLPANLVLNSDGTLTGQTSIVGTTYLDITVTDVENNQTLKSIPLVVGQKVVLNYTVPDPILYGNSFDFDITADVTPGTIVNWTVTGADWLTQTVSPDTTVLNLVGTTALGVYPVTVQACVETTAPPLADPWAMTYGETKTGTLPTGAEVHTYTFTGTSGDFINILLQSAAFDTYLKLKNPSGVSVKENDDFYALGTNSFIEYSLDATGDWIIEVDTNPGNYTLNLKSGITQMVMTATIAEVSTPETTESPGIVYNLAQLDIVSDVLQRIYSIDWTYTGSLTYTDAQIVVTIPSTIGFISASSSGVWDNILKTITWDVGAVTTNSTGNLTVTTVQE